MGTPFTELYENVLTKIKDHALYNLDENEVFDILSDYLRSAIVAFIVCKQNLSDRTKEAFNVKLTDVEIEILTNYMVIEYIDSNFIRIATLLKQSLPSKDFNAFSQANHLDKMTELREMYRRNNETLLVRYSWLSRK